MKFTPQYLSPDMSLACIRTQKIIVDPHVNFVPGEYGSSCHINGAVCISPGYDAEKMFSKRLPQPYDFLWLLKQKRNLAKYAESLKNVTDIDKCMKCSNLPQFEKELHNIFSGNSSSSYWERNNPMRDVDDISTPVLCVNSLDDPICVHNLIEYDLFEFYPNFLLVTTDYGGHNGFLDGSGNQLESWAEKTAVDYLEAVTEFMQKYEITKRIL